MQASLFADAKKKKKTCTHDILFSSRFARRSFFSIFRVHLKRLYTATKSRVLFVVFSSADARERFDRKVILFFTALLRAPLTLPHVFSSGTRRVRFFFFFFSRFTHRVVFDTFAGRACVARTRRVFSRRSRTPGESVAPFQTTRRTREAHASPRRRENKNDSLIARTEGSPTNTPCVQTLYRRNA